MSDENKKDPRPESSSSLSPSGLPSTDQSLERVLGAIAKTISSFEAVAKMIYAEIIEQGKLSSTRHELTSEAIAKLKLEQAQRHDAALKMLGKMRLELASLTDQLSTLVKTHSLQLGISTEAKAALDRTRENLERTRENLEDAVEDITGSHPLLSPEDEEGHAPRAVRVFLVKAANFVWPAAVRGGKAAAVWTLKLIASSAAVGGVAKIVHDVLVGAQ